MRKHRIERAIVLGLILSTSIYGTSFAAEQTVNDFVQGATGEITVNQDTTVTGDGTQSGDTDTIGNGLYTKVDNEWINNKVIVVGNSEVVFNDVALNNATITGDGKIIINNILLQDWEILINGVSYHTSSENIDIIMSPYEVSYINISASK